MSTTARDSGALDSSRVLFWTLALVNALLVGALFAAVAPTSGTVGLLAWTVSTPVATLLAVGGVILILAGRRANPREVLAFGLYCTGIGILLAFSVAAGARFRFLSAGLWTPVVNPFTLTSLPVNVYVPLVVLLATGAFVLGASITK
jgi:hypothetical protein